MHTQEQVGPKIFSQNEAFSHFKENSFVIPQGLELHELDIQCIDDRAPNKEGNTTVGFPGAGAGTPVPIFKAIAAIEGSHQKQSPMDYRMIMQGAEKVVGTMSFHTDEKEKDNLLCCAGCGYMNGALTNTHFGLTAEMVSYLKDNYLPELSKEVKPLVYPGKHWASAVFVIDDPYVGVQTHDKYGNQVYRLNRYWYNLALLQIIENTYPMMRESFPSISLETYKEEVMSAALMQIKVALGHLWPNKSVMVFKDGQVSEVML